MNKMSIKTKGMIAVIAIIIVFIGIPVFYATNTESGKRWIKDVRSDFGDGLERSVKVYDVDGDLIYSYEGKFDIDFESEDKVKFDDENGKRHIIYIKTGAIIVDEK